MRVLIVDDHELIRRGIRSVLSVEADWEVCGEAVDGLEGVAKARELSPDVVIMDVSMPHLNGLDATREIRKTLPSTEVLIVSQHESQEMARQARVAGAKGYVVKSSISADLLKALARVGRHESCFEQDPF